MVFSDSQRVTGPAENVSCVISFFIHKSVLKLREVFRRVLLCSQLDGYAGAVLPAPARDRERAASCCVSDSGAEGEEGKLEISGWRGVGQGGVTELLSELATFELTGKLRGDQENT